MGKYLDIAKNALQETPPNSHAALPAAEAEAQPKTPEIEWPEESEQAICMFGSPYARLFPFVGERVETPMGEGVLKQVLGKSLIRVALDANPQGLVDFYADEVLPLELRKKRN